MPRYEMMYILASSVSDDQVQGLADQISQYTTDAGGTNVQHELMGKKKLAYPIKKTRNGHYGLVTFEMPSQKVLALDAKIRTQGNTIIRHIIVNLEEHLERMEKDQKAQNQLASHRKPVEGAEAEASAPEKTEAETETVTEEITA